MDSMKGHKSVPGGEQLVWRSCDAHPLCLRLNGQVGAVGEWKLNALPGFHRGCRAELQPVTNRQGVVARGDGRAMIPAASSHAVPTRRLPRGITVERLDGSLGTGARRLPRQWPSGG